MGYLNNDSATKETYGEGWFLTYRRHGIHRRAGLMTIQDRIKELIKVRGTGVALAELEYILLDHPSVQDAAVIGIKDEYSRELPRAEFLDVIPKRESGKILRRLLRDKAAEAKKLKVRSGNSRQ